MYSYGWGTKGEKEEKRRGKNEQDVHVRVNILEKGIDMALLFTVDMRSRRAPVRSGV